MNKNRIKYKDCYLYYSDYNIGDIIAEGWRKEEWLEHVEYDPEYTDEEIKAIREHRQIQADCRDWRTKN